MLKIFPLKKLIFAFLLFLITAIFITYPLIWHMGEYTTGYGDELLIAWIQNWVIHAIFSNPLSIFNANTFYPYSNSLAYSESFITTSLLSIPALKLIGEPITTVNFTFISSLVLLPFGIFLLSFYLTGNFMVSIFAALLVIFSPVILDKKVHLQMLSIEWVPLSILAFLLYVKKKTGLFVILSMIFFLLQLYNSFMPAYFIVLFFASFVIYYFFEDKKILKSLINRNTIFIVLITVLLSIPIVIPYFKVSNEFKYVRNIRDTIHFALQPEDLLYPSDDTRLAPILREFSNSKKYPENAEIKPGYLGLILSGLCIWVVIYAYRNRKRKGMAIFYIFLFSAILGLILSFGPFLHINRLTIHKPFPIPLPYIFFYYLAPGFAGFRNSARFEVMFVIFISIPIALMLAQSLKKYSKAVKTFSFLIAAGLLILEYKFPIQFYPVTSVANFPKVFSWLAKTPSDSKIVILPIFNWNMWGATKEVERQLFSTVEFRKMINGASGFSPPPWQALTADIHNNFPNNDSISTFRQIGIDYIVVDKKSFDEGFKKNLEKYNGKMVLNLLTKNNGLTFVKELDGYYVYKITKNIR